MKKLIGTLALLVGISSVLVGCDSSPPSAEKTPQKTSSHTHSDGSVHQDGDEHGDHDHDHDHSAEGHSHGAGPHGGTIVDWGGGKFHLEFTVDHEQQMASVYILGNDEKTPTAIDAEDIQLSMKKPSFQLALKPVPQDGDADGKASLYQASHEQLKTEQNFSGSLSGLVDGTPYSGNFSEDVH